MRTISIETDSCDQFGNCCDEKVRLTLQWNKQMIN